MAKRIITALEITDDYIKLAQAKATPQGCFFTDLNLRKITAKAESEIAQQLSNFLYENRIKVKNLIVVIPRHLLTIRTLRLPSADNTELASMVNLQASKQIPYPPEEIITDFKITEKDASGFSKVLLAIAHKDIVGKYINILDEAGLKPQQFMISSQALSGWFGYFKTKVKNTPDPVAIIEVDTLNSNLVILYRAQLVFSRSIAFNAQEAGQVEINNFLEEIKRSFSTYQKEKLGPDISKIILTGASNYLLPLAEKLKTETAIEVEIEEPEKHIEKSEDLVFPAGGKIRSVSLVNLFGAVLTEPKSTLNLIPSDIRRQQEAQVKKKTYLLTTLLLVLIVSGLVSLISLKVFQKESYLSQLEYQVNKTSPQAQKIQKMIRRVELIEQRLNSQGTSIDVLYELYRLIPAEISLRIFNLQENGTLTLQGTAVSMSEVFNLVNTLEKSSFFQNVEVKYTSRRRIRDKEITDFQITATVSTVGKRISKK